MPSIPVLRSRLVVKAVATTAKKEAAAESKPALTPEVAKDLYSDMVLGREFEEMCAQMYYRGKMFGFVHLYSGQEAVSSGECTLVSCKTVWHTDDQVQMLQE
jgi:pyruvate dehydrogenase E1 component alpha subunit